MLAAKPLDSFRLVRTASIEEMRSALAHAYAAPVIEPVGPAMSFDATINHCQLVHTGLNYGAYGASVRLQFPETDLVSQIFPIRGRGEALLDGTSVAIDPNRSVVISPNAALKMTNNAEYERLVLSVNSSALTKKLAAMIGESINAPLKMHPVQDFTKPAARILRDHFMFVVGKLNVTGPLPALVVEEIEQTLMAMFLHANLHNYSDRLERKTPGAASWQVRRSEEYVEANWAQPIRIEDLAAVTGVSARSLFKAFKQFREYSPMQFVKRVRLRQAKAMLEMAGPSTTVKEIALACGFADLDRFNTDYQMAFGELPSATRNRLRGSNRALN